MTAPGQPSHTEPAGAGRHFLDIAPPPTPLPPPLPGALPPLRGGRRPSAAPRRMNMGVRRGGHPDKGSRALALAAALVAIVLVPLVIYQQQRAIARFVTDWREKVAHAGPDGPHHPPDFQFALSTKLALKMGEWMRAEGQPAMPVQDDFTASMWDLHVATLHDQVRLAIVQAELRGAEEALQTLRTTERFVEHGGGLAGDIAALRQIYRDGPQAIDQEAREALIERHGWYGRLALQFGAPKGDPERRALLKGGGFTLLVVPIMLGLIVALLASVPLGIVALVYILLGRFRLRFTPPAPGGSVYIETFIVFLLAFLAFIAVSAALEARGGGLADLAFFVGPWVVAPVVLWPLLRGVPWARFRREIGWTSGEGVLKEMGCGVVGYLAVLPAYVLVLISALLFEAFRMEITGGVDEVYPPAQLPFDLDGPHRWLKAAGFLALLALWAPLVEETVFRGGLFRHVASRIHWVFAALLTAVIFGAIHPYAMFLIVPVSFLGVVFAGLRQWRDSLIAPITAHALHNGTIGVILVLILLLVAD